MLEVDIKLISLQATVGIQLRITGNRQNQKAKTFTGNTEPRSSI